MPSPHQYGPDQPELAPNSVTVLTPAGYSCGRQHRHGPDCRVTRWPVPEVRPLPAELVRQRQQLNALAAAVAAPDHAPGLHPTCPDCAR